MNIKPKNNIEFISFNDGICDIYYIDESGERVYKYKNLGFSSRILGYKRAFTAASSQVQVDRVIRIPQVRFIDNHDTIEIKGVGRYNIELVQDINITNPFCKDLTLRQLEMFEVK